MSEDKLYRIKTKKGAHLNKRTKEDGARAALQFDSDNQLQGPVDLIEVDKADYTIKEYIEIEKQERGIGEILMEDAVAPAMQEALYYLLIRAAESGAHAVGDWAAQKAIPSVKAKGGEFVNKVRESHAARKAKKAERKQNAVEVVQNTDVYDTQSQKEAVVHSKEEVDQILHNMRLAALYIAAGIRELSNTVIRDDGTDPEIAFEIQTKLRELSTEEVMKSINFMLEDKNRELLDEVTIRMFEAFRNREIIVEDKVIPFKRYLA